LLQVGVFINFFGNGLVAPYLVVYLHFVRGIPLAAAALAPALGGVTATTSGLLAGVLIDRLEPRTCLCVAMTANACAYLLYTGVHFTWEAFLVGLAVGAGTGTYGPSSQALLAGIVAPAQRAAALSQQRMSAVLGLSVGGAMGGLIVAVLPAQGYVWLLVLDSATFLAFAGLGLLLPNPHPHTQTSTGGYATAVGDGRLRLLAAANLTLVAAGVAPMMWVLPAFARGHVDVPAAGIGLMYAVNAGVILTCQLAITRVASARRPADALALSSLLWAAAWLIVAGCGWFLRGGLGGLVLAAALVVYAAGECVYTAVLTPTTAAIAPAELRGRYLAITGFAWQAGFMIGPPVAATMLAASAQAFPLVEALVCLVLAASMRMSPLTRAIGAREGGL